MNKKIILGALIAFAFGIVTTSCSSSDDSKDDNNNTTDTGVRYEHKVLIEDFTGTWCQWCPRVTYSIEKALEHETLGNKIVPVAVHSGDIMEISAGKTLDREFNKKQTYPFAILNRADDWISPQNNNLAQVYNKIDQTGSPVGIKISSQLTNSGGTVSATFKFSQNFSNLKYSIYILENNVVLPSSPQKNSTTYYGGNGNPNSPSSQPDFIHNDVLRAVFGTATGNALEATSAGKEVAKTSQNVTYNLYHNNLSKVEVVVFVSDASGKVLNVQKAHANETVDYILVK